MPTAKKPLRQSAALALAVAAVLMASCAPPPAVDSGVEGQVWIGPMCPVVQAGTDCPDAPLAAELVVEDENGRTVARGESTEDGSFRIPLPPGLYRLVPQPGESGLPFASPVEFTIIAGQWVRLVVIYDSGIR